MVRASAPKNWAINIMALILFSSSLSHAANIKNLCDGLYSNTARLETHFFSGANNPIIGGIPLPKGSVNSAEQLSVVNSNCHPLPFQADPIAYWPDESIKAVRLTLPDSETKSHFLAISEKPLQNKRLAKINSPLTVVETSDSLIIKNRTLAYKISKDNFSLFKQIYPNHLTGRESLISGGDIYMINAFNNQHYLASNSKPTVTVETAGPITTTVKVQGELRNTSNKNNKEKNSKSRSSTLMHYQLRYTFYATSNFVDLELSVIDRRPEKNVQQKRKQLALSVIDYGLTFNHALADARYFFGAELDKRKYYSGPITTTHSLIQLGEMFHANGQPGYNGNKLYEFNFTGVGKGKKAQGWGSFANSQHHISLMIKDFWQQYPNKLTLTPKQIQVSLHPKEASNGKPDLQHPPPKETAPRYQRANTFYFNREGGAKTNQMRLYIGLNEGLASNRSRYKPKQTRKHNSDYQQHILAIQTTADWYTSSGAFGDIIPANRHSIFYDDYLLSNILHYSKQHGELIELYGWRDFGDRMRPGWGDVIDGVRIPSFYNDTHVGANQYFTQFIRTKEPEWYELAELSTRHFMDIDISHTHRKGYHKVRGRHIYFPPGEIHAIKHSNIDHETRSMHAGHAHLSGLSHYYLLTGDRRTHDVLQELRNWWLFMGKNVYAQPYSERIYTEAERDYGWPLYVINELVKTLNDKELHIKAGKPLVEFLIQWWKTPGKHTINGKQIGYNDYRKGTGWWRMTNMDNGSGTGTNPWMAGPLLSSLIQFKALDQHYSSGIDHQQLDEMLYQTMNYIVKHGWVPDHQDRLGRGKGHFVYSESQRYRGDIQPLLYPLSYLYRQLENDKALQRVAHPEWYNTAPLWHDITTRYYKDMATRGFFKGSHKSGFYGYETIFPIDFLKIMSPDQK